MCTFDPESETKYIRDGFRGKMFIFLPVDFTEPLGEGQKNLGGSIDFKNVLIS